MLSHPPPRPPPKGDTWWYGAYYLLLITVFLSFGLWPLTSAPVSCLLVSHPPPGPLQRGTPGGTALITYHLLLYFFPLAFGLCLHLPALLVPRWRGWPASAGRGWTCCFVLSHPPPRPPPKGDTWRYGSYHLSLITYYLLLYFCPPAGVDVFPFLL